jgi:1-deoxy-D-xylulose-5-phosphate reductoisomerase
LKRIIILGCTGSIGLSTINAVKRLKNIKVVGLHAHFSKNKLLKLAAECGVENLCLSGIDDSLNGISYSGSEGLKRFIRETDAEIAVNGIAGSAGLIPSVECLLSGKDLALANKETIVMAGDIIFTSASKTGRNIIPVDSEHSAIFQMYRRFQKNEIDSLILTASGGAFREIPLDTLKIMTPEEALKHPTWNMGKKITIDSASMANKGLEIIEACRLFCFPPEKVQVIIHPQSTIHSFMRTVDGVLYAQMSNPDMEIPIQNALTYPHITGPKTAKFDFTRGPLSFLPADFIRYPMLKLAYKAAKDYGLSIAYNAANEIAAHAFLDKKIIFTQIHEVVQKAMEDSSSGNILSIDDVLAHDEEIRYKAEKIVSEMEIPA